MKIRAVFHDLAEKWEEDIASDHDLTCCEIAGILLDRHGRNAAELKGLIYLAGTERLYPDKVPEGVEILDIYRILGGG